MAADNKSLGTFILDGIPPAPAGVPQIEVKFDIDANGILSVSAKDKGTGKEQSIKIEGSSGVSEEEIEKMKKEAEMHKEEDEKKKKLVDVQNQAHQSIATTEKLLKDNKDKMNDKDKKELEDKIKALKDVKDKDDVAAIEKAMEELMNISMKVGQEMYKQQGPSASDPTKPAEDDKANDDSGDKKDDDKEKTVDAEFEEKDDKKKK
jgi:molecular chaperone DnaK